MRKKVDRKWCGWGGHCGTGRIGIVSWRVGRGGVEIGQSCLLRSTKLLKSGFKLTGGRSCSVAICASFISCLTESIVSTTSPMLSHTTASVFIRLISTMHGACRSTCSPRSSRVVGSHCFLLFAFHQRFASDTEGEESE